MKRRPAPSGGASPATSAPAAPEDPGGRLDPVPILAVDDRPDRLAALEASLVELGGGVEIVRCDSGKEALRHLLRRDFAVVLLDVHMPVMNGFETAALIRQRRRSEHTPIIFITAYGPSEIQVTKGYELGAVDYIFSPVVPEVLRAKVSVFIDLFRKTAQVERQAEWLRAEAERRAERLETRLKALLDALEVGVFRATTSGRLLEANRAFLDLFDVRDLKQAAREGVLARLSLDAPPEAGEDGGPDGHRARDLRIERPDGSVRWLTVTTMPNRGSEGEDVLDGLVEDVTSRRGAEDQLRATHAKLESQARELTRSNADLQRFAYVVSHDLQEPLRMVSTFIELLARRYKDRLDEDARLYISYASDGTRRMQDMIHGLLDFCILETTAGRNRPTDCGQVLDKALAGLRVAIHEAGAQVTHERMPVVIADDVQLAHVFQNLLANALKFRRDGAPPLIHVAAERLGPEWVVSVRDNGIGIDADSRERLFMMFRRLPGAERYPGSGIGLAICKRIVERQGGRIWMDPAPGGGSIFAFTLPAPAPGAPEQAEAPTKGRKESEP